MACMTRDHPRRCGTFIEDQTDVFFDLGSSPQMRGTCCGNRFYRFFSRIIPAGTGHFTWLAAELHALRDHPRRCGAFKSGEYDYIQAEGSSPQVRGICVSAVRANADSGIIPAGAGHFLVATWFSAGFRDHPRRCGAFPGRGALLPRAWGSSPQVRGIYSLSWNIDPKYSSLTPSYR